MTNLGVWSDDDDSNTVFGYDGSGFRTAIPPDANLTVFVDTLYRHIGIWHNSTEEVKGITLNKYWLEPSSFWNISMGNSDYHLSAPQGLSNMTAPEAVQQGSPVPIFMSLPLFFQSDPSYLQQVQFQPPHNVPNMTLHNTEILVEPISGITMKAAKRVQVNVLMNQTFVLFPQIPSPTYIPVAWFELTSTISDPLAAKFRNTVLLAKKLGDLCPYVMGSLGGLAAAFTIFCVYTGYQLRKKSGYEVIDTIQ